jgi:hypothetical protein
MRSKKLEYKKRTRSTRLALSLYSLASLAACNPITVGPDQVATHVIAPAGKSSWQLTSENDHCNTIANGYVRVFAECMIAQGNRVDLYGSGGIALNISTLPNPPSVTSSNNTLNLPQPDTQEIEGSISGFALDGGNLLMHVGQRIVTLQGITSVHSLVDNPDFAAFTQVINAGGQYAHCLTRGDKFQCFLDSGTSGEGKDISRMAIRSGFADPGPSAPPEYYHDWVETLTNHS